MKQESLNSTDKINLLVSQEQEQPHAHKPFMTNMIKVPIKTTPIGYQYHQIEVPEFDPLTALTPSTRYKVRWGDLQLNASVAVFLKTQTNEQQVLKYLTFIENYLQQKSPDYFAQGKIHIYYWNSPFQKWIIENSGKATAMVVSLSGVVYYFIRLQRTRSMALDLLHSSNYNYTQAKFYILFPYYKTFNTLRCHQPLILTDKEMEYKINAYVESLKNNKQNDLMKWVKTIENQLQSRIHISKINHYMDIAKHNKYDIPGNIKILIESATKIGKDIKRNYLNSKNSLQKLQAIKNQLQDQKIVTNQMIHFEQTVSRAQDWIKKQIKFQEQYFYEIPSIQNSSQKSYILKEPQFFKDNKKIQNKILLSLFNQYNSLPLHYPSYESTTLELYNQTNKLILQLPSLTKSAKTRKSEQNTTGVVKLNRGLIAQLLQKIESLPVQHEDFISFQCVIRDGLEQLQRIAMFLEDLKIQKNLKNLNSYQKLLADIPVENDVQRKLYQKIQYYELIDKIKKDISNPMKYESLKDQLLKLKQIGYENQQHAKLESRVMTCMGWHESQQIIKQQKRIPNRIFLILNQKLIKSKMIKYDIFQSQLLSARHELNISDDILKQSQTRLEIVEELKNRILEILEQPEPQLLSIITTFTQCYENGISFEQFDMLFEKMSTILIIIAKIHYLLMNSEQIMNKSSNDTFYFTNSECQKVIDFICQYRHQMKDLRTKQTGDELIEQIINMAFPKQIPQWRIFQQFMKRAQQWSDKAMKMIEDFKNNDNLSSTRDIIDQSKYCLHSKQIQQQLNKIEVTLKWRQKISKKMMQRSYFALFTRDQHAFMAKLQKDMQNIQQEIISQQDMMHKALDYMHKQKQMITSLIRKTTEFNSQKVLVLKLSQMNKFVKQIDRQVQRYGIRDRIIDKLKQELQIQLAINQDWKERYLAVKRFEKKKIALTNTGVSNANIRQKKKDQEDFNDGDISFDLIKDQKQDQNLQNYSGGYIPKAIQVPYVPLIITRPTQLQQTQKKKYIIKNGQFCWYFKLLILLFEFYNACKLKFMVEEFIKLKIILADINRFFERFYMLYSKQNRTDEDYQVLDAQACKILIFSKESYVITNKHALILSWKTIAQHVLRSVPVINMELKIRRVSQLRDLIIQIRKKQELQQKLVSQDQHQITNKRRRKPNQLYQNADITRFGDDILISNNKKRKSFKSSTILPANGNSHPSSHYIQNDVRTPSLAPYGKKSQKQQTRSQRQSKQNYGQMQQFLNTQFNLQYIIDDPKQYCICRNGIPNENSVMVMCQTCQQWYHIQCIGMKKHQVKTQSQYLCVGCKSLSPEFNDNNLGYFWDHYKKISQYSFIQIYKEGQSLGVITKQLKKIRLVYNEMKKWKQSTNALLRKLVQQFPVDIENYYGQIYALYLQSLWLPTIHYESVYLKRLMKHIKRR